ncbi:acyl-CoA/acyl-ACP dehydrogenase [Evansella sp. AB-P1]|uniref:acyl-CoA dehydrogenase family protein n=1 Tax=Evansella sp. AB-P1 TaxID=3037653 RepID=UPI002420193F|nr:acyl-CoA dehydrogenase family protein [Evansella sp. AB-P1]MDG5786085.1 acyl-CoA/acyl-ACP dehydrogenase [Evansella sp. AB-P1]
MDKNMSLFLKTEKQKELYERSKVFIERFQLRASKYDQDATFPIENFNELKEQGMTKLTVPIKYGGEEISLYDFLIVQETLSQGDGATGLSLGWHNGTMMQLRDTKKWTEDVFEKVSKSVVQNLTLINTAATEPSTGSPARGGKPETRAVKSGGVWVINGLKTFTSLAPILDWIIITATITDDEGNEKIGEFLLNRQLDGITFNETWNTLGMRATRSDDMILENVEVSETSLVATKDPGHGKTPQGWLLHIPACYIGIASAARNDAIEFAKNYQPNSLPHPISEVPEVRRKVAEMDLELKKARHFMYHVASIWDEFPQERERLGPELAAVKTVCTNAAIKVVDLALRIVGGQSLHKTQSFERYYRDVRAGLHNPPSDDITTLALANRAFE